MEELKVETYRFGEYEVNCAKRCLLKDGEQLAISSKAFEVLQHLLNNHGKLVSKAELLDRVWPDQFVEENNLSVQIWAIRKALGESKDVNRFLVTVPGKGYKFVGNLELPETGDLVIENRTVSRVVIEGSTIAEPTHRALLGSLTARWQHAVLGSVVVIVVAAAGFWLYASRAQQMDGRESARIEQRFQSRIFTTNGGVPHRVAISNDGKSVAYVQRQKGLDSVWIGDLETGNSFQIVPPLDRLHSYIGFSPNGRSVYFNGRDDNHKTWTLMRVSAFGGAVDDLVSGVHSSVSFSPDGQKIVFIRKDGSRDSASLITADATTGKNEAVLFSSGSGLRLAGSGVTWSPDGNVIGAVAINKGQCEVVGINVDNGSLKTINRGVCNENSNLAWMPDGSGLLATASDGDASLDGAVRFVRYPTGESTSVTGDSQNYANFSLSVSAGGRAALLQTRIDPGIWISPTGSPTESTKILDGSRARLEGTDGIEIATDDRILFSARSGDSYSIWEMESDGTGQRQLMTTQGNSLDTQVKSTADGRYIVFRSTRSGGSEIWRANRDGSGAVQLTHGGINDQPDVSPDGQMVLYRSTTDRLGTIWRISIEGGNPKQVTNEQSSWPVFSFDGTRFACVLGRAVDADDKRIAIFALDRHRPLAVLKIARNGVIHSQPSWSPDDKAVVYKDLVSGLWRHELTAEKPALIDGFGGLRVFSFNYSKTGNLVYSGGIQMREIVILEKKEL